MSKDFKRHEHHKLGRISTSWRKPRGLHHKVRLEKKGYPKKVKVGYGTSKKLTPFIVHSAVDLVDAVEASKNGSLVMFSSTLGMRKKQQLLTLLKDKKVVVSNIADDYDTVVKETISRRKDAKVARHKRREARQKELEKTSAKKKDKDSENKTAAKAEDSEVKSKTASSSSAKDSETKVAGTDDEKATAKKEKDKVLIHKE